MNAPCNTPIICSHSISVRLSRKLAVLTMLVLGVVFAVSWFTIKMLIVEKNREELAFRGRDERAHPQHAPLGGGAVRARHRKRDPRDGRGLGHLALHLEPESLELGDRREILRARHGAQEVLPVLVLRADDGLGDHRGHVAGHLARHAEQLAEIALAGPEQRAQLDLLHELNERHRTRRKHDAQLEARIQSFELAYRMQSDATDAFDITREPEHIREMYGEGTQAMGDFYQISNQVTLGKSEEQLLSNLKDVVPNIIDYERRVRGALVRENRPSLHDQVSRAYGILQNAQTISSEETMHLLSSVRMGINLGLIDDLAIPRSIDDSMAVRSSVMVVVGCAQSSMTECGESHIDRAIADRPSSRITIH